jgi:glycosylphosphatidylinositol transamidase (GPIT) subunit GPI8
MRLHFEFTNSKKWIKILQTLIDKYNFEDIHRSIGMRPCEVNKSNEDDVFHKLFSTKNKPKPKIKFSVGDRVRIPAFKKTFGNKYSKNWTEEIFIVNEILNTIHITYKIIDLNNEEIIGSFYNEELQKTKF